MDEGIHKHKHPDRSAHVTHSGPHAHHGAGVVVGLKSRAVFTLGKNDKGVEDLVKLANVEEPAVEGKTLVPHAARLVAVRSDGELGRDRARLGRPDARALVVDETVAETGSTAHAADAVNSRGPATSARVTGVGKGVGQSATEHVDHADPGPGRIDSKEHIVSHDKRKERLGLADGPGSAVGGLVVLVEKLGSDSVDRRNGQRHTDVKGSRIEAVRNAERGVVSQRARLRKRQKSRVRAGGQAEV